ncbi:MAG: universal stress protein [Candidatus Paralactobacillus gallistercoris]|uniref:Universal stress protein n=1 Tax=Candidatus Paralactobacillus gallistercoris TaxID=2838724 RepID=A0A948X1L9_9LACO|nr:universal stress protein [Candidatus Paralactobacillus gallistercoris]
MQQYQNILVAIDGSYEAELAFRKAIEVANRNKASLYLVHVVDTRAFQNISSFDSAMVEQVSKTAEKTLEEYVTIAQKAGINDVKFSVEYGSPKTIIARDLPKNKDIDLIIIGATGLNAVERLLIGSVTEYVTRNAICDVLVVRTDLENKPALDENQHREHKNKFNPDL